MGPPAGLHDSSHGYLQGTQARLITFPSLVLNPRAESDDSMAIRQKIGHGSLSTNRAKTANCVSASASDSALRATTGQDDGTRQPNKIKTPIRANNTHPNNQSRFCFQD